ncbi:Cysteine-rich receptor-like protein kinase 2 [Capsicum annuum]|nr:Cysteine-rich receptor-like protein kinase 2 [Capsicum annuum]
MLVLLLPNTSVAKPRSQTVKITCGTQLELNTMTFVPNFVGVMDTISQQTKTREYGVAVTGTRPDANYGLAQCYEGRALYIGCVMRYSDTNFLNAILTNGGSSSRGANDAEKLVEILQDINLNFKYSILIKATGLFDKVNKLGKDGFGMVYKGRLADGREIAVKRLFYNNSHRVTDFYNEVNIVSSVEHKNLTRLLGCSCLGPKSLLVYEFLPNQSLDRFIFDPIKGKDLNWLRRFEIIIGTTEGLIYLHENTKTQIIHRDIKASNILLDSRFRAKIADFGLARSFQEDKSHISTAIANTLEFMAPECLAHGQLMEKKDVYTFRVLLLEIVTGRQSNQRNNVVYTVSLVSSLSSD